LQNYGFSIMQHSVFLTCNFLQKVLAKNTPAASKINFRNLDMKTP